MDPTLIRFDRRTFGFLGVLLLFLVVGTAFKLHGSSIGMWNRVSPARRLDQGVLLGTAKRIRIDEWEYITPAIISQARSQPAFPVLNPRWGSGPVALLFSWPARHWSTLVRPQFWGFFVLDLERGFAFYWNLKAVWILGGMFLLLMLLTGNHFGMSLLGAAWVFWSAMVQWDYSSAMLPETIGCLALLLVAAHYLALSPRRSIVGASALVLLLCSLNFAFAFYPPFQVPLFYLGIAILIGSLGSRLRAGLSRTHRVFRVVCAALALSGIAALLVRYYSDARPTIELMRATVYPGSRISTGGELTWAQVFSGLYGFFMTEEKFPQQWFNVCEASSFVLLFPVPVGALLWRAWRRQRVSAIEWSLIAYLAMVTLWLTVRWPRFLALISGFGLTHDTRPLLGLGIASICLCCIFLAEPRAGFPRGSRGRLLLATGLLGAFLAYGLEFNRVTGGFATTFQLLLVTLAAGAASVLLLARRRGALAACILVPSVWSYGLVNPVAIGLGPVLEANTFQHVSLLVDRDPDARWTVYGPYFFADLFKAAGAQVFNGTLVVPPLEDFRVIDPKGSATEVYNRYAHVGLTPGPGPGIKYAMLHGDSYEIQVDPAHDVWRQLRIKYVALPFESREPAFLAKAVLVEKLPNAGLWIYKYEWGPEPRN